MRYSCPRSPVTSWPRHAPSRSRRQRTVASLLRHRAAIARSGTRIFCWTRSVRPSLQQPHFLRPLPAPTPHPRTIPPPPTPYPRTDRPKLPTPLHAVCSEHSRAARAAAASGLR